MVSGKCHCGKTSFWIAGELPDCVTKCTCSICLKRGALHAYYSPEQFSVSALVDRVYRWNTELVSSHFCGECGCATYSESPCFQMDGSWDESKRIIAVNARLLDGFDADAAPITVVDGRSRCIERHTSSK
jgi:hypothetical protein